MFQGNQQQASAVAVVEWRWIGHHPYYFVRYAIAIAQTGRAVFPLCPDPDDFTKRLKRELAILGSLELGDLFAKPQKLGRVSKSKVRPARFRGLHEGYRRFGGLGKSLRMWEKESRSTIQLVFFCCIFDHDFEHFGKVEKWFGFRWSGLYMHARSFRMPGSPMPYTGVIPRPEELFKSQLLAGIAVLDEGAVEPMRKIVGEKPVVWMPDFSDGVEQPHSSRQPGLAEKIQGFAQGRPIVSLVGYLVRTKGLEQFTKMMEDDSLKDVFFFLGGEVNWMDIDERQGEKMKLVWERGANIYPHLQFISSDEEINAIIAISDVVFAVYRDFPNSSNLLTKAASFKKPVIVSEGYVMSERVEKFQLGEVVPEDDTLKIAATLKRMVTENYQSEIDKRARWKEFKKAHSVEKLPQCFRVLLGDSLDRINTSD